MAVLTYVEIVSRIKRDIIQGPLRPGDRMATRVELEKRFDTTPVTLNRAMKILVSEGFVTARMGSRTQVALHPPHLSHFALAFPFADVKGRSRFYEALRDEAIKLKSVDRHVTAFYGIESNREECDRLIQILRAQCLAGLIFAGNPYHLTAQSSPLIRERGVFRTSVMMPDGAFPYPTVYPDLKAFLPTAFRYLASRGRKRVAVVMLEGASSADFEPVQAQAAECGLVMRPHWLQASSPGAPDWARQSALLLLHSGQTERPDAVVIADDNLVEGFTAGIRDSGIRVVSDREAGTIPGVEVVAQANFPYPTKSAVPVKRLGYDITKLLAICLERIEQQRRGLSAPSHTAIPAEFDPA